MRCEATSLVGRADAAYGDQSTHGKCRLGYVVGLTSSTLRGPCHIIQWTSKFTRKMAKSSLGGEVYAFSEMLDHMALLKEFYAPFVDASPDLLGFVDCESLFSHLKKKKTIAEKFLARHFLAIQQAVESGELANVYWLPGLENPADSLAKIKSDMVPLLRMTESGCYNPGLLRPLRGLPSNETPF